MASFYFISRTTCATCLHPPDLDSMCFQQQIQLIISSTLIAHTYSQSHTEPRNSSRTKIAAAAFLFTPILKPSLGRGGLLDQSASDPFLLCRLSLNSSELHMSACFLLALAVPTITLCQTPASDPPRALKSVILLP